MIELVHFIKRMLPGKRRSLLSGVRELPDGQRTAGLAKVFLDECVRHAADFVREQIANKESPFQGVPRDRFFQELMSVNFWMLDRLLEGKRFTLMERIYGAYRSAFPVSRNGNGKYPGSMAELHAAYNDAWDEVTGHQDAFGRKLSERIFGAERTFPLQEASFWVVNYAHELRDDLDDLIKRCRSMDIALS